MYPPKKRPCGTAKRDAGRRAEAEGRRDERHEPKRRGEDVRDETRASKCDAPSAPSRRAALPACSPRRGRKARFILPRGGGRRRRRRTPEPAGRRRQRREQERDRGGTKAAPKKRGGGGARQRDQPFNPAQRAGRDEPRGRTHEPSAGSSSAGGRPSVDAKLVGLERMGGERGVEECGARDEALRGVE